MMTEQVKRERRLREILVAASAGEASDSELEELNGMLASSSELRDYATLFMQQVGQIRWSSQSTIASSLSGITRTCGTDDQPAPSADSAASGVQWVRDRLPFSGAHLSQMAWAAAAACMVVVASWAWFAAEEPIVPVVEVGPVNVDQGTIRMKLVNVGYLIADGPAEFELEDPMRLRVDSGRVNIDVTQPSGHGFVVATPDGEVTDLGTRFGVDVQSGQDTGLVVFEGEVDLRVPGRDRQSVERLIGGEGVLFGKSGQFNRIMSIGTGRTATFQRSGDIGRHSDLPLIVNVSDTLLTADTKRFYEIVYGGFKEDALAYVDRPYEWNGMRGKLPEYLLGAEYIKTFNDYKQREFEITVQLSAAADVYLLWDKRIPAPPWLAEAFEETGDVVGLDTGGLPNIASRRRIEKGAGRSIDFHYNVWHRRVDGAGVITLGSLQQGDTETSISMYGILAVPVALEESAVHAVQKSD